MLTEPLVPTAAPPTAQGAADEPSAPGTAARERRTPGLSPSRAKDFQQCPLLFRFKVVDRLPEPPSRAAVRGTLVHAVLENLFEAPAGRRTIDTARDLVRPAWEQMVLDEPDCAGVLTDRADPIEVAAWFAEAEALLETYFTLEDPNRLQPEQREMVVSTLLDDGFELRGIIDRLDVAPNGAIRVVDYKTGRSPREGYEGDALFQMRFYALLVARLRGVVPAMLQLVYLGDGVVLRDTPDAAQLAVTEKRIRFVWDGIRRSAETNTWATRRGPLCDWCNHRALCPEFGGTPPEVSPDAVEVAIGIRPLD